MVERTEHLEKLKKWQDKQIIKVVTGIRRSGKSTLFAQFIEYLLHSGVKKQQIISLNFEDLHNQNLLNPDKLHEYLLENLVGRQMTYIFLDEVQKVPEFAQVVDSIYLRENVDIYITGSNAYLLSGELSTLLSGRYVEIKMFPLSFKEFGALKGKNNDKAFHDYLTQGGFPYLAAIDVDEEMSSMYLEGMYNTIVLKDIEERHQRKSSEERRVNDMSLLKNIARYLADNIGKFCSAKKIADYLISSGRKVASDTVETYLRALTDAFLFYPVERYDIKGKNLLKTNPKYYIADLGLRNYLVSHQEMDLGYSLENVVYFELFRRGYRVNVGKLGDKEIDFIAKKGEEILYVQVCANMMDEDTFKREMAPLKGIKDNYEKLVLTLDKFTSGNYDGIKVINLFDWLLLDCVKI